ncbi:prephenate dehydratase [Candidatus Izemoplasma sp. B36]|uniref:prephenate dehydratase n=1 Tax=Candidatus Izemoplasma sp. B36 TaxID=3242468 RepID=UPI003556CF9E
MIRIGYQGIRYSNSEEAALQLANRLKIERFRLIPLVSSFNVLDNIESGNIDYGVIAYENSRGGKVTESVQAMKFIKLKHVGDITIPIHHYLFVKNDLIKEDDILKIASHPQAFIQCRDTLNKYYPNTILINDEDTATAARKLALELFDENTAVLCRKNAGIKNGLTLLKSYLEDRKDNTTTFKMFKK